MKWSAYVARYGTCHRGHPRSPQLRMVDGVTSFLLCCPACDLFDSAGVDLDEIGKRPDVEQTAARWAVEGRRDAALELIAPFTRLHMP